MSEGRNRVELDRRQVQRQYEYTRDQRMPPSLRSYTPREDALARLGRVNQSDKPGLLEQTFKLGLTIAGAAAFHKFMFRSRAGMEMLGSIGTSGRQFSYQAKKFITHAATLLTGNPDELLNIARVSRGVRKPYKVFEEGRIQDIEDALTVLRASGDAKYQQEIIHGEAGLHLKRQLKGQGKRRGGWLSGIGRWADTRQSDLVQGLDSIRMQDLLEPNQVMVSQRSANIVRQGIEAGLVSGKTRLGKGSMINRATGQVVDASWATGRNLWGGFIGAMNQVRIPIIGFKLGGLFSAPSYFVGKSLFGQQGIKHIRAGTLIPGVAKLNRGGLAIGDTIFGFDEGKAITKLEGQFRWFDPKKDSGIARVVGAQLGHFSKPREFDRVNSWWNRLQEKMGMGPQFATESSAFAQAVMNPWRRVTRGIPELKGEMSGEAQSFIKRLMDQVEGVKSTRIPNAYKSIDDIPAPQRFLDKLRASAGSGRYVEFTQPGRSGGKINGIRRPDAGTGFRGEDIAIYNKKHGASLFMNYLATRPSEMLSWFGGVGYRPGKGPLGFAKSAMKFAGVAGIGMGIVESAKYLDYVLEDTVGLSPIKMGADIYTRGRLAQKWAQDSLGITDAARWMEDRFPKSINSPASGLFRAALPIIGGVAKGKVGAVAGLGASILMSGLPHSLFMPEDLLKSQKELEQEYEGLRRTPVRQNRWWELNSEEFTGGKIKFFKQSWYAQLKSGYEYTDVKYGSKGNYWKYQSNLPTPSNWFGLRKLFNPNFVADAQAIRRPYPNSGGGILGVGGSSHPVLDATGGGMGRVPSATSGGQLLSGAWESATEHLGVYKFLGETVLGVEAPFEADIEVASASEITSLHRKYWDADLGGLLGGTELIRRFILPRNSMAKAYNPMPNTAPGWLPGIRSQFNEDTRYFLDFHRGDPYTKVPKGEMRMPGPGYEALYRMHSGIPGVYDAYDRYKILADVAPYSKAFRHYRTIVRSWAQAGLLDQSWAQDFDIAEQEYEAVREGGQFTERKFTSHAEGIKAINTELKYGPIESTLGGLWESFTHDIVPAIPFGRKMMKAESPYESYLENEVYGLTYQDWRTPIKSFVESRFTRASSRGPVMGAVIGGALSIAGGSPLAKIVLGIAGAAIGGTGGALRGRGWVPTEKRTEFETMEYFDKLKYVRAKRLQGIAVQEGDFSSANMFKREAERTIVGLPKDASLGQMQAAMPKSLKPYFRKLLQAPKADRMDVMKTIPQFVQPVFSQMWGGGAMGQHADEQVLQYFSKHKMPGKNWMGWMPQVPFGMSKLKIIQNEGMSAHSLHEWESESLVNPVVFANMETPAGFLEEGTEATDMEDLRRQLASIHVLNGTVGDAPRSFFRIRNKDTSAFEKAIDRFM